MMDLSGSNTIINQGRAVCIAAAMILMLKFVEDKRSKAALGDVNNRTGTFRMTTRSLSLALKIWQINSFLPMSTTLSLVPGTFNEVPAI